MPALRAGGRLVHMPNPFVYGEVVPGEAFVDREVELDRLIGDLAAGQKVFLISPRRYGKSSLVRQALDGLARRGALTVEVTVSSYSSYLAFLEGYARALAALETKWERARTWLTGAIQTTRPELRYEPKDTGLGRVSVAFPLVRTDRDVNRLANEIFALPGQVAAARKRPVVVALDEFQAIEGFNGGSVEHALRAAAQHQRQVGYVFAGSEPSLMEKMIGPRRPFYKAGPGHAAREDPGRRVRRLHRAPVHQERHQAGAGAGRGHRGPGRQPALRRAAAGARDLGRRARRRAASAPGSSICTPRSGGCSTSRRPCSRPSGSD